MKWMNYVSVVPFWVEPGQMPTKAAPLLPSPAEQRRKNCNKRLILFIADSATVCANLSIY